MAVPGGRWRALWVAVLGLVLLALALSPGAGLGRPRAPERHETFVRVASVVTGDQVELSTLRTRRVVQLASVLVPGSPEGGACLAGEARAAVASLLPVGTAVTIEPLPGVRAREGAEAGRLGLQDGTMVDAYLVERGVAALPGLPGLPPPGLAAAADRARSARVGLHDPAQPCTVPGQVRTRTRALHSAVGAVRASQGAPADVVRLSRAIDDAIDLRDRLTATRLPPTVEWQALSDHERQLLLTGLDAAVVGAQSVRFAHPVTR